MVAQGQQDHNFKTVLQLPSEFKASFGYMRGAVRKQKKEKGKLYKHQEDTRHWWLRTPEGREVGQRA